MLYCARCRRLCEDTVKRCPACKNSRLRAAHEDDLVLLHRADEYTAARLAQQLETAGLTFELSPCGGSYSAAPQDAALLPTDQNIYVRYGDLPTAQALSAALKEEIDRANALTEDDPADSVPPRKRIVLEILSVTAFLLLVMAAVFGADAFANWVKTLLGM